MHRSESELLTRCSECGAEFSVAQDRGYCFAEEALCFDCAVKRGGVYDGLYERWVTPPRIDDLARPPT